MRYKCTLSTKHSTGHFDAGTKQEIMDMLEGWFLQYGIDYKKHNVVPSKGKKHSTHWEKGHIAISCNFNVNE